LLLPFYFQSFTQSTNISGVINSYYNVVGVLPSNTAVRVGNPSGLAYGNTVLLIQMKGVSISTSNNSSFGDTTALNNAGNYEVATICEVAGDTIYFFHELLNNYTISGKVQLVKFGAYYSANVIDTVKAAPWDDAAGTGGVLAIKTDEDITLNAPLCADYSGYTGGPYLLYSGNCSNFFRATGYVYDGNNTTANGSGAFKGEGAAIVASNQDGGRGAPANGGGGGNNHNNGGGGGANLAAGGRGGGNYSSTGCTGNYRGEAGKALSSWNGTKIFAGGGGGAGHSNNITALSGGGNGGGIIIVIAKSIYGNGYKISANGKTGGSNISDGASGGGGGGTVIMQVTNYFGSLTVEANGGNGGDADDDLILNRCYGAGGGGSGGVIYFNGALPAVTTSVNGGAKGTDIDVNGCGTPVLAENGNNGSLISNYTYRSSTTPSPDCGVALPVTLVSFNAYKTPENKVQLTWEITSPGDAKEFKIERRSRYLNPEIIMTSLPQSGKQNYALTDPSPVPGENIYRLIITENTGRDTYSPEKKVVIGYGNQYTVFPNPAKDMLIISGKLSAGDRIILSDITGKVISENKITGLTNKIRISLPTLQAGIYLLRINEKVEKIVIQ